jgi:hypothetical protein
MRGDPILSKRAMLCETRQDNIVVLWGYILD